MPNDSKERHLKNKHINTKRLYKYNTVSIDKITFHQGYLLERNEDKHFLR